MPENDPEAESDPRPQVETVDLREVWADFARSQGGTFLETERRGIERFTPASVWRPVINVPMGGWTLKLEASRQALLSAWRKERTSLRDWVAPGGDARNPLFDFTTTLTIRYRSRDGFRFALEPGDEMSLARMRHNVEIGPAVELPGLPGVSVHATDKLMAQSVFRSRVVEMLTPLLEGEAAFELGTVGRRPWWAVMSSGPFELHLRVGILLVETALLAQQVNLVREVFDGLRRAGSVDDEYGRPGLG